LRMEYSKDHARFYTFMEWRLGRSNREIHAALVDVWQQAAPGYSTVARWSSDFASGDRESFEDGSRCGRPVSASSDDATALVQDVVEEDPRLSTRAIAGKTGISQRTVCRILSSQLQMRRLSSYWVPQVLTENQRMQRVQSAVGIRDKLVNMGDDRYRLYVVEDETWVNFDVEDGSSSAVQWVKQGMPRPRAVSHKLTPRKCLVMLAFSACKRFNVKALPYGETINGDVYQKFVREAGEKWQKLRRNPVHLYDVVWQHDNARPHAKKEVVAYFQRRKVELLHQAPYSPDLNLCDRWLFAHLKKTLRQQQFQSHHEVEEFVLRQLHGMEEGYFKKHVDLLIFHCQNVIDAAGDYVVPRD